MMNRLFASLFMLLLCLVGNKVCSQDLAQIGINKGFKLNGSINNNTVLYHVSGLQSARRDPFTTYLTGNLNINAFGYSVPFSFSYANKQRSFSQPFNQFSFSPQYKWIKAYIGYSSMSFSNYTLASYLFSGGGVELSPGKWHIAAMYGRLKKAVEYDVNNLSTENSTAFKRLGYGAKIGYETNGDLYSVNLFTAKDELHSIALAPPGGILTPKQNITGSVTLRKKLFKNISAEMEYAVSAINTDMTANRGVLDDTVKRSKNLLGRLLPANNTTRYFDALNSSIGYQGKGYGLQLRYERVAPEYETLGAYYFNNDFENITIAPNVQLFRSRLNLTANIGLQRNNLDANKNSTTSRFVGSFNLAYLPNDKWNFTGSYSNFSTYTNIRPRQDPFFVNELEKLNFYQINNTYNAVAGYNFGTENVRKGLLLTVSYQKASDRSTDSNNPNNNLSDFYTGNVGYNHTITSKDLGFNAGFNYYSSNINNLNSIFWGPSLAVNKAFLHKVLKTSFSSSYNSTSGSTGAGSSVLNMRASAGYTPKFSQKSLGNHTLSLSLNYLKRFTETNAITTINGFRELTTTGNYTYSF
jgi:hypothetical protein